MPAGLLLTVQDAEHPAASDVGGGAAFERDLEELRGALHRHCSRMLRSASEAEDAVQETMVRAWLGFDRFERRSSLRSWTYAIATRVCLTMLDRRARRPGPVDLHVEGAHASPSSSSPVHPWVLISGTTQVSRSDDPGELASSRAEVRAALSAAVSRLPPRQRAILLLRDVLSWRSSEVAELLDTSVASVNSALQRARASMAASASLQHRADSIDPQQARLLARYVDAFERCDVSRLVTLLRQDARGLTCEPSQ